MTRSGLLLTASKEFLGTVHVLGSYEYWWKKLWKLCSWLRVCSPMHPYYHSCTILAPNDRKSDLRSYPKIHIMHSYDDTTNYRAVWHKVPANNRCDAGIAIALDSEKFFEDLSLIVSGVYVHIYSERFGHKVGQGSLWVAKNSKAILSLDILSNEVVSGFSSRCLYFATFGRLEVQKNKGKRLWSLIKAMNAT